MAGTPEAKVHPCKGVCNHEKNPEEHLFTPLTIRSITFKNRLVVSPMCQYSAQDGFVNDWHLVHLGSRAVGGSGLLFTEGTSISPEGRITPDDLGIWKNEHIAPLQRIVKFVLAQNCVPGMQLAHAGRKASRSAPWKGSELILPEQGGWVTLAPSAVPNTDKEPPPAEMTREDIANSIQQWKDATVRVQKAGFQVLEIHAAHGYLIHQFLSPVANKRTDNYGGSFENRTRYLLEVTDAVRSNWPAEYPLFIRLSTTDYVEGGWNEQETIKVSAILKTKGVDLIDCSSGGVDANARIPVKALYQLPFAESVKKGANILTGAVGLITTHEEAEMIVRERKADLVFMARGNLRDPYFPFRAADLLGVPVEYPDQYARAGSYKPHIPKGHPSQNLDSKQASEAR